jgi:hypothetical protein
MRQLKIVLSVELVQQGGGVVRQPIAPESDREESVLEYVKGDKTARVEETRWQGDASTSRRPCMVEFEAAFFPLPSVHSVHT